MIAVAAQKEAGAEMNNDYDIAIVEDFQRTE
jgi:hypothetical protein